MKMSCYKNSTGTVIGIIFNVIEKLNKEINILYKRSNTSSNASLLYCKMVQILPQVCYRCDL